MRKLMTVCQWLWLTVLYVIFFIAMGSMTAKSLFSALILPFAVYGVIRWMKTHDEIHLNLKKERILWWGMAALGSVLLILFAYMNRVESLSWDWGKVIRSASEYVLTGNLKDKIYFSRYPNNQLWYCVMVVLFKVVHKCMPGAQLEQFYMVSIFFSCCMVIVTILLLHHIAVLLWNEKIALFVGAMAWVCLPLYMWGMYAYTDTSGMLILVLGLYMFIKAERIQGILHYVYLAVFGLLAALAYGIKVTVFILVIAGVISMVLQSQSWKRLLLGFVVIGVCFGAGKVSTGLIVDHIIPLEESFSEEYKFPLTHWIMMSLDYGGYVQEDVDFTAQISGYDQKKEANIEEIKKRLKDRNLIQNIQFFFYTKRQRTWGDGTFSGCEYLSRGPRFPESRMAQLNTYSGKWNWLVIGYTSLYYGLLLVGMILSSFFAVRDKKGEQPLFIGRITLLGIAAFMTIWECNSRYLVVFIPIMILLSAEGYIMLRNWLKRQKTKGRGEKL